MKIGELKQLIEEAEDYGATDDTPVFYAAQPSWPFKYEISSGCVIEDSNDDEDYLPEDRQIALWLIEGTQTGYLAGSVKKEIGW